ncbi:hypothetical protein ThvES_00020980, partial [Thiovulum sp. ES]
EEDEFFRQLRHFHELLDIKVAYQYRVGNYQGTEYRIDGYIESLKLAIEYEEGHHENQTKEDYEREREIAEKLGKSKLGGDVEFVRPTIKESHCSGIAKVMRKIKEKRG